MEIFPGAQFSIWRKLEDPFDATTYYVLAEVRDMISNAVLATLQLTDQGNRIYSKSWSPPEDMSGSGRWIAVSTRVYTDSGYSSLSEVHKEESREYKIINTPPSRGPGGGMGGAADIDYKKIRKMIEELLESQPKPSSPPSLQPILERLAALQRAFDAMEMPATDMAPLHASLDLLRANMERGFGAIPVPEKVDIGPLQAAVDALPTKIGNELSAIQRFITSMRQFLSQFANDMEKLIETRTGELKDSVKNVQNMSFTVSPSGVRSEKEQQPNGTDRASHIMA